MTEKGKLIYNYATIGNSGNVIYVNPEKAIIVTVTGTFKPTVFDWIDFIQEHIEPLENTEERGYHY